MNAEKSILIGILIVFIWMVIMLAIAFVRGVNRLRTDEDEIYKNKMYEQWS